MIQNDYTIRFLFPPEPRHVEAASNSCINTGHGRAVSAVSVAAALRWTTLDCRVAVLRSTVSCTRTTVPNITKWYQNGTRGQLHNHLNLT